MNDTSSWVLLLACAILVTFIILLFTFWLGWRLTQRSQGVSPYTGVPLRHARELPYYSLERVAIFMHSFHQYDNRIFRFQRASFCRETGRIFQNSVSLFDTIFIDWTFLRKRYPGTYVSWGSLNPDQKKAIREVHDSLEEFQTEYSSPTPAPRAIEPEYVYTKPGPLYVDIDTKVLLGWKIVPETNLEVLIVQKPIK